MPLLFSSYRPYLQALDAFRGKCGNQKLPFLSHALYLSLPRAPDTTVLVSDLAEATRAVNSKSNAWAQAASYDADFDGFLTLSEVTSLVADTACEPPPASAAARPEMLPRCKRLSRGRGRQSAVCR